MDLIKFTCNKQGKLLKIALIEREDLSYTALQKSLRNKDVKVNGIRTNKDILLNVGDKVEIFYVKKQASSFSIVYQDKNVLVINKAKGFTSESVYQSLLQSFPTCRFIHRLDRNTNGLMIFALNDMANEELLKGFKTHAFIKEYFATVYGNPKKEEDVLTAYLVKDKENSFVKIFDSPVKGSVLIKTGYKVVSRKEDSALLRVRLYTGKTHQIRAHLAHVGHFIIGDGKYGNNEINKKFNAKKQMLSACLITLKFNNESSLAYLNDKTFDIREDL